MPLVTVGPYVLCHDAEATIRAYEAVPVGAPEACGCADCRNFIAVRERFYGVAACALLAQLGVAPGKEAEVYRSHRTDSGLHRYNGWMHLVGEIMSDAGGPLMRLDDTLQVMFLRASALLPESFEGLSTLQLEVEAEMPWVLDEPEPEV